MAHTTTLEPPKPSVNLGPIAARVGKRQERVSSHALWLALSVA
jgi:hypothetical protein